MLPQCSRDCQWEGVTRKTPRRLSGLYQPAGQAVGRMWVTESLSPLAFHPSFCFVLYMLPFFFLSATNSFPFSLRMYNLVTSLFCIVRFYVPYVIAFLTSLRLIYALRLSLFSLFFLGLSFPVFPPSPRNRSRAMTCPEGWRT